MKTLTNFINPAFATLAFAWFALCPVAEAVSPAPDGGYPNWNTAEGQNALFSLTTGAYNTAVGGQALFRNTGGGSNTATGLNALYSNTTGSGNTANGFDALFSNTTSSGTTATGYQALYHNTTGPGNTATGYRSLVANTTGSGNTAIGSQALQANTNNSNTAVGRLALANNTTGSHNIALGEYAGQNITTGGGNIDIGHTGFTGDSDIIRLGAGQSDIFISVVAHMSASATSIVGISGIGEGGANIMPVYINNSGQLGTQGPPSSRRFKKEIKPMDQTSEAILELKPVTFQYKSDTTDMRQFGLIAEEVAKVDPDLVVRDNNGEIYSVRYDAVNAMLLNEFLKEHRTVQEQQKEIDILRAELKEQRALIQKVSDKVGLHKPAPQTVLNNR